MTTNSQKELELSQFKKAMELLGFNDYCIINKCDETPDLLIEIDGQTIGVEVTSICRDHGDGNSKKIESDLRIIAEESVKIYNSKKGIPLIFSFGFDGTVAASNRKQIAQTLGDFLYEYTNKHFLNGIEVIQEIDVDQAQNESLSMVRSIFAKPTDNEVAIAALWTSLFDTVSLDISMLEKRLREKEKKLPEYKKKCNKIWLLITLPSMLLAGDLKLPDDKAIKLTHKFNAVYVLDEYRDQVLSIRNP